MVVPLQGCSYCPTPQDTEVQVEQEGVLLSFDEVMDKLR